MSRITAALCVYQQPDALNCALAAVQAQSLPPHEIIVIDDGSIPPLAVPDGIRLIRHTCNCGLGAARATALTAATGDLIFFIDADVVPAPDCLARLAAALAAAPRAAGAGARIQEQSRSLWDDYRAHYLAQNPAPDALFLPGLAVLYHTAILRKAGGFDPAYRTNGEDYALGLRLSAAGHTLLHAPEAHVEHHRHDTCVSFVRLLWRYHYFEGLVRRRQGLPWFWNRWLLPPLNLLAVSRRILFVERAPALLLPALLALPVRWWAAGCLTVGRP